MATEPLLAVRDLTIAFGGLHAVDSLSFDVPERSIVSLIGPNGAGKTTVLNCISGFVRGQGSIRYRGSELVRQPAYRRAALGIARTFQSIQLFPSLSLLENVIAGEHAQLPGNVIFDVLRFPVLGSEREARARAMDILRSLGIDRYAHRPVDGLPFGVQKLAGVARALAIRPGLLLLDEPASGLNRQEVESLADRIIELPADYGVSVLLVEHNMRLVMAISERVVVLDQGRKLMEGSPDAVGHSPVVIEAYLGRVEDPEVVAEVRDALAESP